MGKKEKNQYPRRFWIGIDIGKNGAICIREKDLGNGTIATQFAPMPKIGKEIDYLTLYKVFEPYEGGNGMVVFEKIVPFTANKTAMFSLGYQAGAIEMICVALAIPYTKVPPQTWQKEMFAGVEELRKKSTTSKSGSSRDTKGMALIAAQRIFSTILLNFGGRATKPHEGIVDALLMSEYARRRYS